MDTVLAFSCVKALRWTHLAGREPHGLSPAALRRFSFEGGVWGVGRLAAGLVEVFFPDSE